MKRRIGKKTIGIGTVLLLIVVFLAWVGTTNALPKAEDAKDVVTYIGNLKVDVQDSGSIGNVTLNTAVERKVALKNDGESNQFVRVMVLPVYVNANGTSESLKREDLLQNLNTTDWKDGGDGYYYYLKKLEAGQQTSDLFKQIQVPAGQSEGKLTIYVKGEAITAGGYQYRKAFWNVSTGQTVEPLMSIDQEYESVKE